MRCMGDGRSAGGYAGLRDNAGDLEMVWRAAAAR